jgi:hypothetical protein
MRVSEITMAKMPARAPIPGWAKICRALSILSLAKLKGMISVTNPMISTRKIAINPKSTILSSCGALILTPGRVFFEVSRQHYTIQYLN